MKFLFKHKVWFILIVVVLAGGGYFWYKHVKSSTVTTTYKTEKASLGMLVTSVTGTGQVSTSNQVDIKPKTSGTVVAVNVKNGQQVKEGDLLVQLDSRDAGLKVSEAKNALENARLALEELLSPTDEYTILQAENSLADAKDSLVKLKLNQASTYQTALDSQIKAADNLDKSYEDAYNDIASVFLGLPDIMTGLDTILHSNDISSSENNVTQNTNDVVLLNSFRSTDFDERSSFNILLNKTNTSYSLADDRYQTNFDNYRDTTRYSEPQTIEDLLDETIETLKKVSDTLKNTTNAIDYWVDYRSSVNLRVYNTVSGYQTDLGSYTSQVNSYLTNLLSAQTSIEGYQQDKIDTARNIEELKTTQPLDLASAERSLKEKEEKLADLKEGATDLEIKNQQLTVAQKQNDLATAQSSLADYYIRAPFDGLIVEADVAKGDTVSSGTVIASLITTQNIAEVTLNEIDAAQVKVGQKVNLTFDAIADLTITGEVAEVATIGTVSQGVVSYDIKIGFDIQDERVKPGMSVGVNIITASKTNVLLVSSSAVKTQGGSSYVEVLVDGQPQRKTVTTGLSNDTMIEITSGLSEGDEVVTQTITTGGSSTTSSASSSSSNNRGNTGFGGEFRMLR